MPGQDVHMAVSVCVICSLVVLTNLPIANGEAANVCHGELPDDSCNVATEADAAKYREYKKAAVTSRADFAIRELLDQAETLVAQDRLEAAKESYTSLLVNHPHSPRGHFGRAITLEKLWKKSGQVDQLIESVDEFDKVIQLADESPDLLFIKAVDRLVLANIHHLGRKQKAIKAQRRLIERFPDRLDFKNALALIYFDMGKYEDARYIAPARTLLMEVLDADPNDGFAQAYYGFILIFYDKNLDQGVDLLMRGLQSKVSGTERQIFYKQLGRSLIKLGRMEEARELHEEAAKLGLFLSPLQRSTYNVKGLTSRPWWTAEQLGYGSSLEAIRKEWRVIRDEALRILDTHHIDKTSEQDNLLTSGRWTSFSLYSRGRRIKENCELMPRTCEIVAQVPDATSCTRGQIKISVLEGGTSVLPHTGPTNCRIRAHLGLRMAEGAHIRLAGETREWQEGEWLLLDDSFEHEVWHDGTETRVIFMVDFWHPELTEEQRNALQPIGAI